MNIQRSITESKPRHEYKENMFKAMLIVIVIGALLLFITNILTGPNPTRRYVVLIIGLLFQVIPYVLWRRGKLDLAVEVDLIFVTGSLFFSMFYSRGVFSSFVLVTLVPLTLAATILRVRFMLMLAVGILAGFWGLLLVEGAGYLPDVPATDLPTRMMIINSMVIIMALILWYHIHKMYHAEEEIVKLHTAAERLRVHQQLTIDLAHDLRTPVSVLSTSSYLILRRFEKGMDIREQVGVLDGQIKKLTSMIDGFLELSTLDEMHEDNTEHFQPVEIGALVKQLGNEFQEHAYARKRITLTVEHLKNEPVKVLGDEMLLRRSLINLIANGIKYGREKGAITLQIQQAGTDVLIRVIDDGIGIPPNRLEQIFERFYRVNEARTSELDTGTGIGLAVSKRIVELHKGTIAVESTFGEGCVFTVRLPAIKA